MLGNATYSVEKISASKEFPVSQISKIQFGAKGLLWIATSNGLYYYDGYKHGVMKSLFFNTNTLADDRVIDFTQDSNGDVWLLTGYGVEKINVLNRTPSSVLRIPNLSDEASIHFVNDSLGLVVFQRNCIVKLSPDLFNVDTIYKSSSVITSNVKVVENKLMFCEGNELIEYSFGDKLFSRHVLGERSDYLCAYLDRIDSSNFVLANGSLLQRFDIQNEDIEELASFSSNIVKVSALKDNKVIVATDFDVFLVSLNKTGEVHAELLSGVLSGKIVSLLLDQNGFPWIATKTDVLKVNPFSKAFKYSELPFESVESDLNKIVFESNHEGIVFMNENAQVSYYNSATGGIVELPLQNCNAACLKGSELFLGSNEQLLKLNLETGKKTLLNERLGVKKIRNINDEVWVASDSGLFSINENELVKYYSNSTSDILLSNKDLYVLAQEGFGRLEVGVDTVFDLLIADQSSGGDELINDILYSYDGKLWIATDNGLFIFNADTSKTVEEQFEMVYEGAVYALIEAENLPEVWFSTDAGIGGINYSTNRKLFLSSSDGVKYTSYLKGAAYKSEQNLVFVTGKQVLSFNPDSIYRRVIAPNVFISRIVFHNNKAIESRLLFLSDTIIINPENRFFELELSTLDYFSPENTIYEYSLELEGDEQVWQRVQNENTLSVGRLSPGKYELLLRAGNSHGLSSDKIKRLEVIVKAPVAQTKWAYLSYLITIIALVVLLIRIRTRNLTRINREYKDKERIARKIELQKEELTVKNKNITDSINYARRIQLAMMPSKKMFSSLFPDSFVLHMPKDIVSGDFYWVNKVDDKVFFSAIDCTGHGVPGAFMSIIGVELFRRITEVDKTSTPAEVLNSLSRNFERVFGEIDEMKLRDGMDLAFCTVNEDHTSLEYAGAFNPLYIIRDSSIMEIKGDRHSVGVYEDDDMVRSFNNHVIPLMDGDTIYIFTDGFADQFGGPEGKKYKYRRFRHLLLALHQLPMEKQKEFLRKNIMEWKGDLDQVDDIMVMGIKIHQKK